MTFPEHVWQTSGRFCLQVSVEEAIQALVRLQQLPSQAEPNSPATPVTFHKQADADTQAAPDRAPRGPESVPAAAKQMLQTLATQHSTRRHTILDACHVEQLLQPCLKAFCQSQAATSKGSMAAAVGTTASGTGQRLPAADCGKSCGVPAVCVGAAELTMHDCMAFR